MMDLRYKSLEPRLLRRPEEIRIDLLGLQQILDLLQPGMTARLEDLRRHVDRLEDFQKLARPRRHVELALEARQRRVDLVEVHAVVALVAATGADRQLAAG